MCDSVYSGQLIQHHVCLMPMPCFTKAVLSSVTKLVTTKLQHHDILGRLGAGSKPNSDILLTSENMIDLTKRKIFRDDKAKI